MMWFAGPVFAATCSLLAIENTVDVTGGSVREG